MKTNEQKLRDALRPLIDFCHEAGYDCQTALAALAATEPDTEQSQSADQVRDATAKRQGILLTGLQALCVSADQEWTRQGGMLSQFDIGWLMGQIQSIDFYTEAEKEAVYKCREYVEKLSLTPAQSLYEVQRNAAEASISAEFNSMFGDTGALEIACTINKKLGDALQFYAEQQHFVLHDADVFDMVSGEPQNWQEDESNTIMFEDGSVAKAALASTKLDTDQARDSVLEEAARAMAYRGWTDSAGVIRALKSSPAPAAPESAEPSAPELSRIDKECLRIGQQIQHAAEFLPEGWLIQITVENGYGGAEIFNPKGDNINEFDAGDSDGMSYAISKCIEVATSSAAKGASDAADS